MNREKLTQVLPAGGEALRKLGFSRERDPRVRRRLFSWRMFVLILLVLLVLSAGNVLLLEVLLKLEVFSVLASMGVGTYWIAMAVIAAIILQALPELLREFADYRMLAYSVLLIVIMLLNASPKFAELKGNWSIGNFIRLLKRNKQSKEAAEK